MRCAVAASQHESLSVALTQASHRAVADLGEIPTLAVVFISKAYGDQIASVMENLNDVIGSQKLIACTAEGVLADGIEFEDGPAVSVWLAHLPGATIETFAMEYRHTADGASFLGWPTGLLEEWPQHASVILLADPFSFPIDQFIARLHEDRPGVPIMGGMASGGDEPGFNRLVVDSRSYDAGAVGFVIGGSARIRPVVSQGCKPIGHTYVVTKADENLIVELGGKPALQRLREVFGTLDESDKQLVRTALHVGRVASEYQETFARGDFLVRNVVGADPDSGVIAVGDHVRTGQTIQFHVRDGSSAHDDLRELLKREAVTGCKPVGILLFTCNGRGTRLFDTPNHDAACLQECLGPVPTAGFFAQGEIGPIGERNCLHGFTASVAIIEETSPHS